MNWFCEVREILEARNLEEISLDMLGPIVFEDLYQRL